MAQDEEQDRSASFPRYMAKSVTNLSAFAGFSAETAENGLAQSRKPHPKGLAGWR
jgi:hypothetical protein